MPQSIEVEYFCAECNINFVVFHQSEQRNTHCCWCSKPVVLTGQIKKLEGDFVVVYKDGIEIERYKSKRVKT